LDCGGFLFSKMGVDLRRKGRKRREKKKRNEETGRGRPDREILKRTINTLWGLTRENVGWRRSKKD